MSRRWMGIVVAFVALSAGALGLPKLAAAQDAVAEWSEPTSPDSPERFALELRFGPYTPDTQDTAFDKVFGGSSLLIAGEFDVAPFRIADVLTLGIGGGIGYVSYSGVASTLDGTTTSEKASLTLAPMNLLAVVRIIALPRLLSIPLIFTGKLGLDLVYWSSSTGNTQEGEGVSPGLRWAVQGALELDFFEPRAARALDDEWGINHSFLFFELYGSSAGGSSLPVGTPLGWATGLGFNF